MTSKGERHTERKREGMKKKQTARKRDREKKRGGERERKRQDGLRVPLCHRHNPTDSHTHV